jgi:hypothetical protein
MVIKNKGRGKKGKKIMEKKKKKGNKNKGKILARLSKR